MSTTDTDDEAPIETSTRVSPTEPSDDHAPDDHPTADETAADDPIGTRTRVR